MRWWLAIRAYSFSASLIPVALGAMWVRWRGGPFSGWDMLLALIAGLGLHVAANLFNDVFDYYGHVDHLSESTTNSPLLKGELSIRAYTAVATACVVGSAGIGIGLCIRQDNMALFALGAFGILAAVLYSAGRWSPKYWATGEALVFLSMGLGMTAGGALTQPAPWSWKVLLAGLPCSIGMTLIMLINNLRDMKVDRRAGVRTLANRIGFQKSVWLLNGMITLEFFSLMWGIMKDILPTTSAWGLLFIPILYGLTYGIRKNGAHSKHLLIASLHHAGLGIILLLSLRSAIESAPSEQAACDHTQQNAVSLDFYSKLE